MASKVHHIDIITSPIRCVEIPIGDKIRLYPSIFNSQRATECAVLGHTFRFIRDWICTNCGYEPHAIL